jgi:hypothetical protein
MSYGNSLTDESKKFMNQIVRCMCFYTAECRSTAERRKTKVRNSASIFSHVVFCHLICLTYLSWYVETILLIARLLKNRGPILLTLASASVKHVKQKCTWVHNFETTWDINLEYIFTTKICSLLKIPITTVIFQIMLPFHLDFAISKTCTLSITLKQLEISTWILEYNYINLQNLYRYQQDL